MSKIYNFSAGPATLPEEVLRQAQIDLLDYQHSGLSILEMTHRSKGFQQIADQAEADLREVLSIPADYSVLFLAGGGRTQFAMVPMNLAAENPKMAYAETGIWSELAIQEARIYGEVTIAASSKANKHTRLPAATDWQIPKDAAYLHYTDNETVHGLEFPSPPESQGLPLVSDMSSNLLSRPVDISRYGIIYACAQKNLGPAGITIVIIRNELLARKPFDFTPNMLRYANQAADKSLYNTPPTFPWYVAGLMFQWVKKSGGVEKFAELNRLKSSQLYDVIDESAFYINPVDPAGRSRMNVVFTLANPDLTPQFLQEAQKHGLYNLKGHRAVGGIRASIYNAMPQAGVDALIAFMRDFEKRFT